MASFQKTDGSPFLFPPLCLASSNHAVVNVPDMPEPASRRFLALRARHEKDLVTKIAIPRCRALQQTARFSKVVRKTLELYCLPLIRSGAILEKTRCG